MKAFVLIVNKCSLTFYGVHKSSYRVREVNFSVNLNVRDSDSVVFVNVCLLFVTFLYMCS